MITKSLLVGKTSSLSLKKKTEKCSFGPPIDILVHTIQGLNFYRQRFDIWAVVADPYDSGVIENVKYCPYCGRELKGENDES